MSGIKEEILRILKENPEGYVSGQQLSERLGVSRTAIWKHINALKEEGYGLESGTNRGYRLVEVPDIVSEGEIRAGLVTDFWRSTWKFMKPWIPPISGQNSWQNRAPRRGLWLWRSSRPRAGADVEEAGPVRKVRIFICL